MGTVHYGKGRMYGIHLPHWRIKTVRSCEPFASQRMTRRTEP